MPFVNKLQQTKTFLSIDGFLLIYKFFLLYNLWVFLPIEPTPASHHCLSAPFLFSMYPKYPNSLSFQSCHPLSSPGEFSVSRIDKDVGHNPPHFLLFFSRRQSLGTFRPQELVVTHLEETFMEANYTGCFQGCR